MAESGEKKTSFKDTLNLPQTDFPIRSNPREEDPQMLARWQQEGLYAKAFERNQHKKKRFVFHDGPPYANGHLHLGHAYNKVLKDIITKYHRMAGKHVPVIPGWDCHGLPIELAVLREQSPSSPTALKKACRAYAAKWIDVQREEFKQLGVVMNWSHPYLTMSPGYEADIIRAFGTFVAKGYIERKGKTVPWCASCQTVLANAEIEYAERKDPSVYVTFALEDAAVTQLFPQLAGAPVSVLIWTTTPWTLPLNRAIMVKPGAPYVVLDVHGAKVVVGKSRAQDLCEKMEVPCAIVTEVAGDELIRIGTRAQHPFVDGLMVPLVPEESVMLDEGTAFVHCAPGAGPEDYEIGVRNSLEIYSPVGPDGRYTDEVLPADLVGMPVSDGQIWVMRTLKERGALLHKENIRHPYPHCWRCRNGLIFRATKQWFCDLEHNNLRSHALASLKDILFCPAQSINRLSSMLEGRLEWCLSRQRAWGTPIPALLCDGCDAAYITQELINRVADAVQTAGIEWWDTVQISDLVPNNTVCASCGGTGWKKETDIIDVWFESGVSHAAVLSRNPELGVPADLYLEGSDQHRAWFQSSLLTSLVINNQAPMRTIFTHGFTVDGKGRKMSKSLGNVVTPQEMINQMGTDGLRLWAASVSTSPEAVFSDRVLQNVREVFRKVRNTCRFLLSNLYDFNGEADLVPVSKLQVIDRLALEQLCAIEHEIRVAYESYDIAAVFHTLVDYCSGDLSSFYLDIIKDRLYCDQADGQLRRSAQTACWYILDTLTRLMAPILSFTAERVSDCYQQDKQQSIHLQDLASLNALGEALELAYRDADKKTPLAWQDIPEIRAAGQVDLKTIRVRGYLLEVKDDLLHLRNAVLKELEGLREQKVIAHSLEAQVSFALGENGQLGMLRDFVSYLEQRGQGPEQFFKEFFVVSRVTYGDPSIGHESAMMPGLRVQVSHASGVKCPRCWQWDDTGHKQGLCVRCQQIVVPE